MEIALVIFILVVVAIWYGLLKPVESLAEMASDEVEVMKAERKAVNIKTLAEIDLDAEDVTKAKANLKSLNDIKL